MEMMTNDAELLRRYAVERSEAAFTELVQRHINLVYSAALRQVGGDAHLAQDVTQTVFSDLARKARRVLRHMALSGWLYTSIRFAAASLRRTEARRQKREQESCAMRELETESTIDVTWNQLHPVIDEAMNQLGKQDRQAVLLRHFEGRDFKAVGAALGLNENAARMRADRALEKMRRVLSQRGVALSASVLATTLASQAVISAPIGLAGAVSGTAIVTSAAGGGFILTLTNYMTIPTVKIATGLAILAGAATPIVVQHQQNSKLRAENAALAQQVTESRQPLAANQQMGLAQANADELERLRKEHAELLQLRGEVTLLRRAASRASAQAAPQLANNTAPPQDTSTQAPADEAAFNRERLEVVESMKQLGLAARIYAAGNNDQLPVNFTQMTNVLGNAATDRYEFFPQPGPLDMTNPAMILFREKAPRQRADGKWERFYTLVDGSVQAVASGDGNFDHFEKPHTVQENPTIQQPPQSQPAIDPAMARRYGFVVPDPATNR